MKFLQSLAAQVSLRTQGAIFGAWHFYFILLDLITEPMHPVIDFGLGYGYRLWVAIAH